MLEIGRWLGRSVAWPFSYGYQMIYGDGQPQRPAAGRPVRRRNVSRPGDWQSEWALSPTMSQAAMIPAWRSGSGNSGSMEDLTMCAVMGCLDDSADPPPQHKHSLLSVPIPVEEEAFPAFLGTLPDTVFPRYKLVLPKTRKILVLDLDETLVHSTSACVEECDYLVEVLVEHMSCLYYVHKRPFVEHFLDVVSNWFQLVIYTASLREYADPVVNMLDKGHRVFQKRLFRNACIEKDGLYLKDLSLIDQDLSRICLLDNSAISFILNPENGIFIDSWLGDKKDTGLLDLLPFLDALRFVDDVRSVLSLRTF